MVRCTEQGAQGQTRSICHSRANTLMSRPSPARPSALPHGERKRKDG